MRPVISVGMHMQPQCPVKIKFAVLMLMANVELWHCAQVPSSLVWDLSRLSATALSISLSRQQVTLSCCLVLAEVM